MSTRDSCIVETELGQAPAMADSLRALEQRLQLFRKGETIWRSGETRGNILAVKRGVLSTYRPLQDGRRQALEVFLPGDLAGIGEIGYAEWLTDLVAVAETEVGVITRARLNSLLSQSLTLNRQLLFGATRRQAMLVERLVDLGRRSARQRMAHFLMECHARILAYNGQRSALAGSQPLPVLPFSQVFLSDILGLSTVHVNRILKELRREGLVASCAGGLQVCEPDKLGRVADFCTHYLEQDARRSFRPLTAVGSD